jgi:hypothetical protein
MASGDAAKMRVARPGEGHSEDDSAGPQQSTTRK